MNSVPFGTVSPGNIKYSDLNEDGFIQEAIDEEMIGHSMPVWNIGLEGRISYRDLSLYVVGYGLLDYDINVRQNPYFYAYGDIKYSEYIQENRWTEESQDTEAMHPRLTTASNSNDNRTSSYWLRNASFFKIKNVAISYTLPETLISRMKLTKISVILRVSNLFSYSGIPNLDPEGAAFGVSDYPSMQTYTAGMQISF
jgi:TonB-dependent starch-binding outer membrane protein SusC